MFKVTGGKLHIVTYPVISTRTCSHITADVTRLPLTVKTRARTQACYFLEQREPVDLVTIKCGVFFAERTELLNIIQKNFGFTGTGAP